MQKLNLYLTYLRGLKVAELEEDDLHLWYKIQHH